MDHKKIIIAAAAATVFTAGLTAACVVVYKRLLDKNYIPVSVSNS